MYPPDLASLLWVQLLSSSLLKSNTLAGALSCHQQSFSSRSTLVFLLQMSRDFHHSSLTMAFCLVQPLVLGKRISIISSTHLFSCGLFPFSCTGVYTPHKHSQHPRKHCHSYRNPTARFPVTPHPGFPQPAGYLTAQDVAAV